LIRAVVFDVGGTLVDESRVLGQWAAFLGVEPGEFFATLGAVIERREHHRRIFDALQSGHEPAADQLFRYEAGDLFPDVRPCLEELRQGGYRVAIAGNQPSWTEAFLGDLELGVEFVASSHSWGVSKPDAAFFERLVAEVGLSAREIAYVGDRIDNDVVPALDAGLFTVFLRRGPWGYVQASWPEAERADLRIESLAELLEAVATVRA